MPKLKVLMLVSLIAAMPLYAQAEPGGTENAGEFADIVANKRPLTDADLEKKIVGGVFHWSTSDQ